VVVSKRKDYVFDKIKAHFERNKTRYYIGSIVGVAGITCIIMRGQSSVVRNAASEGVTDLLSSSVRPLAFFSKQIVNIVTVIEREGRGHPGYLTICEETKEIFRTQGAAARHIGVTATAMSRHMLGDLPHINGLHFTRVALI
jgi:hypothetical protein